MSNKADSTVLEFEDGKYRIELHDDGPYQAFRHGERWTVAEGSKLTGIMASEIAEHRLSPANIQNLLATLSEIVDYNWVQEADHFCSEHDIEDDLSDESLACDFEFTDNQKNHIFYHLVQALKLKRSLSGDSNDNSLNDLGAALGIEPDNSGSLPVLRPRKPG